MTLTAGTRLGQYELLHLVGAGGMGEVYRARDTKLHRDVAIKVLPELFASDPDRLSRFEREAQTLAALNHPNVAQIHGVLESPAALVMELVEGEDLSHRLTRGAIPAEDALPIARQVAEALEAAHDRGIVHRDLKPANVKVRPDGAVKVLDFGLAKAMAGESGAVAVPRSMQNSPTFTSPAMTQIGVVLGTASYMSPEQARGKAVDRRADIWAFGCVLYEMLSGRRPFDGETVTDVMSAIVSREPDWAALPRETSPAIVKLLQRCLEKDPRRRLRDIGEARVMLEDPQQAIAGPAAATPRSSATWLVPTLAVAAAVLAVADVALLLNRRTSTVDVAPRAVTRYDVQAPDGAALSVVFRPAVSVSASGSVLAFAATVEGINRIYVRPRAEVAARVIPGSEGGTNPAVSPDGKWVAFFANAHVHKAPIDGQAITIGPARDVRGMTWTDDGQLILTNDAAAPLVIMSADGRESRALTTFASGERTHRWPSILPGGRVVVFTAGSLTSPDNYDGATIEAVILPTGERRTLIKGAAMARYCGDRRLVYSKGPGLFAVSFDPQTLTTSGSPVQVLQAVARDASTGASHFDCAGDGTLVFVPGTPEGELRRLVWADRAGRMQPLRLPPGPHQEVRISPDGTRAVLLSGTSGSGDVWIYEFAKESLDRLTFTATNAAPTWSSDGRSVYYTSFDPNGPRTTVMRRLADGSREAETLATIAGRSYLAWVDPLEQIAIVDSADLFDRGNIFRISLNSATPPEPLVASPANEFVSAVSPGGQWLAYQSDDSGRAEIYVRELAGTATRRQVTTAGGEEPQWSRDGSELFYRTANRLMAIPIERGPMFRAGNPRPLFDGIHTFGIESGRSYSVDSANPRFLLVRPADAGVSVSVVRVVLNW
jgi:Tol biopolymer transport system component